MNDAQEPSVNQQLNPANNDQQQKEALVIVKRKPIDKEAREP